MEAMTDEVTFYRDMWLAQRAENEIYRARLGEMPVSDEASEEIVALRADNERLKACLHDYENTYPEAKDTLRAEVEHWKAIAQAHNDSLVARIEENERLKQACDGYLEHAAGLRAENERLKACLHDYENTYPEAKDTLRVEVEHWKAIAQAHNDSLVARIEENKKLTERLNNRPDWKHSLDLQAENERLREALQQYADMEGPPFFGTPYLARAALQSKGE
jgi:regulator of replication initiation timing